MKRGKRIAFTVVATGLAVVLGLGVLYRRVVLDHVEAWHFQLTRDTKTIEPQPWSDYPTSLPLALLASLSGYPVIFAESDMRVRGGWFEKAEQAFSNMAMTPMTTEWLLQFFRQAGYRVLEQRFPQWAYVVIRDEP